MLQTYSQTIQTNYDKIRPFKISLTNVNCALDLLSLKDNAEILSDAFNMGSVGTIIHTITDEHVQNLNTPTNHLYSDYGKNIVTYYIIGANKTITFDIESPYVTTLEASTLRTRIATLLNDVYGVSPQNTIPVSLIHLEKYEYDTAPNQQEV